MSLSALCAQRGCTVIVVRESELQPAFCDKCRSEFGKLRTAANQASKATLRSSGEVLDAAGKRPSRGGVRV